MAGDHGSLRPGRRRRPRLNLRARQAIGDAKCNDLVGRQRDALWNLVGRPGGTDPNFGLLFPSGAGAPTLTVVPPIVEEELPPGPTVEEDPAADPTLFMDTEVVAAK